MKKKTTLVAIIILILLVLTMQIVANLHVIQWDPEYKDVWFQIGDLQGPGLLSGSISSGAYYSGAWQVTLGVGDYRFTLGETGEDVFSSSGERVREANKLTFETHRWSEYNK